MYRFSQLLSHQPKPLSITSPSDSSIMQAIKGGWARHTFAVAAKSNDKVERKAAVRLSKKDRRVLVESFIKTYQKLNNGSFPSIHITHKEVGGSYYIVREIVRDIIQENRVLAPPKALQKEHKMFDSLPGDYPFASTSKESDVSSSLLSNGLHELGHKGTTEEVIPETERSNDQSIDSNLYHGLNAPAEKTEELCLGVVSEISEGVEVETFPLETSVKLSEPEDAINLNDISSDTVPDQAVQDSVGPIISAVDQNVVGLIEEVNANTSDEDVMKKTPQKSSEILNSSLIRTEGTETDVKGSEAQEVIISHSGVVTSEVEKSRELAASEPLISSNTSAFKNINGTSSVSVIGSDKQEVSMGKHDAFKLRKNGKDSPIINSDEQEETKTKDEALRVSTNLQRDRKPTLDRMNLDSREEVSKKPAHESNPFAGLVKACMTAFSKLFSK